MTTVATPPPAAEPAVRHETDPALLADGAVIRLVHYARVESVARVGAELHVLVRDLDRDLKFTIQGTNLIRTVDSADQFGGTETTPITALVELLRASQGRPMSCAFIKQDGTGRTMRFRLLAVDPLGYLAVEDLDQAAGSRHRKVDLRTLQWLILDGVKHRVTGAADRARRARLAAGPAA